MDPILISLSPNTEKDDVILAARLIFHPWKWRGNDKDQNPNSKILEEEFQKYLGVKYAVAFNSGRTAWLAILESLGMEKGSEVLLQAFTCNAVVNPIRWAGLKPVFVDIDEKTLNIDPADLERKIVYSLNSGQAPGAVLVQHTFGLSADMEKVSAICQKHNLILIEDCAHSLGAAANGKKLGTFGQAAFFSFGRDKIISSVFGGLAVTNDDALAKKLRDYQDHLAGPSYFWILQQLLHPILTSLLIIPLYNFGDLGKLALIFLQKTGLLSKAVKDEEKQGKIPRGFARKMPSALAALALGQLKKLEKILVHQREIAEFYRKNIENPSFLHPTEALERVYMRYSLLAEGLNTDRVLAEARWQKIFLDDGWRKAVVNPPDTNQERMGYRKRDCPTAEKVTRAIINLPTHINISKEKAERIVNFLNDYHGN